MWRPQIQVEFVDSLEAERENICGRDTVKRIKTRNERKREKKRESEGNSAGSKDRQNREIAVGFVFRDAAYVIEVL